MANRTYSSSYILAYTFVSAVAFIYAFIAIALVPYWQELSGPGIQDWWSGPFTQFATIMVPLHVLSILSIIYAFTIHRKGRDKILWVLALATLLICQAFNFGVYGPIYNPALQSGALESNEALTTFDSWAFYHGVRTIAVCCSLVFLLVIGIRQPSTPNANME
ncbi:MAG: hypothetical protein AAF399_30315 [Bacteroidota bacterium]